MSTPEHTWDKSKPVGTSTRGREIDNWMRADKDSIEDALDREHTFPGTYGDTAGEHVPGECKVLKVDTTTNLGDGTGTDGAISFDTTTNCIMRDTGAATLSKIGDGTAVHTDGSAEITALTGKTTPVDADVAIIEDTAASNVKKKLTWSNIKATLKTYFDTLYATDATGVTNGDSHDHSGGDGAQIDHGGLAGLSDDNHSQYHNNTRGDARYALLAKGVTNGNSHDHSGGDGGQISHTALSNIGTNAHTTIDSHIGSSSNPHSVTSTQVLPSQTGNSGKYLTTNGSAASWGTVSSFSSSMLATIPTALIEKTTSLTSYQAWNVEKVYIPSDATYVSGYLHLYGAIGGQIMNAYVNIGAVNSTAVNSIANSSYNWIAVSAFNVSALSGWYDLIIYYRTAPGQAFECKIDGFALRIY